MAAAMAVAQQPQQPQEPQQSQYDPQSEIDELNEAYGLDIKTLDDVAKLPNADKIIDFAQNGSRLTHAYYAANAGDIQSTQKAAMKQKVVNQSRGLDHIKQAQSGGETDHTKITQSDIDTWRSAGFKEPRAELIKMIKKQKEAGW
jgi:hypothetical protein